MQNLWRETVIKLESNDKSPEDVEWVGAEGYGRITIEEFKRIALHIEYDDGFGGQEIASDLVVVGKDFWLERHEYDGSEWWAYKTLPKKPEPKEIKIFSVTQLEERDCWMTLENLEKAKEEEDNETI